MNGKKGPSLREILEKIVKAKHPGLKEKKLELLKKLFDLAEDIANL